MFRIVFTHAACHIMEKSFENKKCCVSGCVLWPVFSILDNSTLMEPKCSNIAVITIRNIRLPACV